MARTACSRRSIARLLFVLSALLWSSPGARAQEGEASVTPAERPVVVSITVEGAERYTDDQLRGGLGVQVGEPIDYERIERGIETLWSVFHVRADVSQRPVVGGVDVLLRITELPVDLEPRFVGNVKISSKKLHSTIGLEEGAEVYLYQAPGIRKRLIDSYLADGFYFVEVREVVRGAADSTEGALPDVIFEIKEGPQVRVHDVVLHGSQSMPDTGFLFWKSGLKHLAGVQLHGRTLLNWKGKKFVQEVLEADLLAMRTVYRERGWLDAVVELDDLEFRDDSGRVTIHIVIDEGVPYTVSGISVRGVERRPDPQRPGQFLDEQTPLVFPESELLELLTLGPGTRYEKTRLNDDLRELRDYYGERGYLSHPSLDGEDNWQFLDPLLRFDVESHQVDVTYRIAQGRQRFIREVMFTGATHTRDRVMRREVTMLPGELADLKKIRRSLTSITGTGYFSDEMNRIEHREPTFRFLPTEDPDLVDLEYTVAEGRVVNFQIQGGVSSNNGVFGRILLSFRNFDISNWPSNLWSTFGEVYSKEAFHGAGQQLDIDIAPGTQIDYFRVRFVEPDLFRTHFKRIGLEVEVARRLRRFDNYDEDRSIFNLRISRRFSPELTTWGGYTYQRIDVTNIEKPSGGIAGPDVPLVPPSLLAEEGVSYLSGLLFDLRWRELDNFINPRDGTRLNWNNGLYGEWIGSDWNFGKTEAVYDVFVPIGEDEFAVRKSWHFALGAGLAYPYADDLLVPYSERFFLGGVRTLRGFAFRGVGPNVGGQPLGGETMLYGSAEYRIPLYKVTQPGTFREIEMFGMLFFLDAGILDPEALQLDVDEVRASYGIGFGLTSPLPLTFNFGFPLKKGEGDETQVFSFAVAFY